MTGEEAAESGPAVDTSRDWTFEAYLTSFLPRFRRGALGGAPALPGRVDREAAILCIDVAGFTALTDEIAGYEPRGAEQLSKIIDGCLARTAAIAAEHGGDVIAFAGDAAWIAWFAEPGVSLQDATRLAAAAALAAQAEPQRAGGRTLQLRATIGAGPVQQFELGGIEGEWHGLLTGAPIAQIRTAGRRGAPGLVIASPEAWAWLREAGDEPPGDGPIRVTKVTAPARHPAPPDDRAAIDGMRLRRAVPQAVLQRSAGDYGEFRMVSVLFVLLKNPASGEAAMDRLQFAVTEAQTIAGRLEGEIYQCMADEKGVAIVMAFGLPPQAHQNDAARAIEAAISLRESLAAGGLATAVGVATGRMFCTVYGNTLRRQFAMIGPRMNLAARLMEADAGVVCDAGTLVAARRSRHYMARALPPMVVHGKADPIVAFVPSLPTDPALAAPDMGAGLMGREAEKQVIGRAFVELRAHQGGVILIEGEAGTGKSALLASALAAAADGGIRILASAGDEIDRRAPLAAWHRVLRDLAGSGTPAEAQLAPLFHGLLSHAPPETDAAAGSDEEGRTAAIRRITLRLLRTAAEAGPLLVAIENVHWLDAISWDLLLALAEAQLPLLVIATNRSRAGAETQLSRLTALPRLHRLPLGGLPPDQTARLVAQLMQARSVAPDVVALMQQRTSGNPVFIGELTRALADHGILSVSDGDVGIAATAGLASADLDQIFTRLGVPPTLDGIVTARLDRLPPAERQLLRSASIVGSSFTRAELASFGGIDPPALAWGLRSLVDGGMLNAVAPGTRYSFRHAVLRDVTYGAIAFAERQVLHRRFAEWGAASAAGQGGLIDAGLGQHFRDAGEPAKASLYLCRAGEQALRDNSNMEALPLLAAALTLDDGTDTGRRARLELALGETRQRLTHYAEARLHSEAGLRLIGYGMPTTAARLVLPFLRELAVQIVHLYAPRPPPGRLRPADPQRLMAAKALGGLVESYFYLRATGHSLYAALRSLNLAEGIGPTPELARGYAIVGTLAGSAGMRKWARRCGELALAALARASDPEAAWWVPMVVGVARLSAGDLDNAEALLQRGVIASQQIGDRRHWRDGTALLGVAAAMRGNWNGALEQVTAYRASALVDKDQRHIVAADREQTYCLLQTGQLAEARRGLALIAAHLERGVVAEDIPARLDLHAMRATLALEAGDLAAARVAAAAALEPMRQGDVSGSSSAYWALFLAGRAYLNFWRMGVAGSTEAQGDRRRAAAVHKALKAHAAVYPVALPCAQLIQGAFDLIDGRPAVARRHFVSAGNRARQFGMTYWQALAEAELARLPGRVAAIPLYGLPLFVGDGR